MTKCQRPDLSLGHPTLGPMTVESTGRKVFAEVVAYDRDLPTFLI